MKILLVLAVVFVVSQAKSLSCKQLYKTYGFSDNLNETIAHAVHSMNVEGLQMFNSRATVRNNIPTVNLDRSAKEKVLPFAPEYPLGSDFTTTSMNMVDKILGQIGNEKDGLGPNWSSVERIAHAFHMRDLWYRIHTVYRAQVVSNPPTDDVCSCLMETRSNGIYQVKKLYICLHGSYNIFVSFQAVEWVSNHYDSGTPITLLNRAIPKLVDANAWATWKDRLLHYYTDEALYDAANFIYCATKDF